MSGKLKHRNSFPVLFSSLGLTGIGVELGVRHGEFTAVLSGSVLSCVVGIDNWSGRWTDDSYCRACGVMLRSENVKLIRLDFDRAEGLFEDGSLDVIYVDGNADTDRQIQYERLERWYPKLRYGGVFAGHDYSPFYSDVVAAVDRFGAERECDIMVTGESVSVRRSVFPSWYLIKRSL